MRLDDILARLRPTARNRYLGEANAIGMSFEAYLQDLLDGQGLSPSDLVYVQGGSGDEAIWPAMFKDSY